MNNKYLQYLEITLIFLIFIALVYGCYKITIDESICVINPLKYAQMEFKDDNIACGCYDTTKNYNNIPNSLNINFSAIINYSN